jgi:hypothetical protein
LAVKTSEIAREFLIFLLATEYFLISGLYFFVVHGGVHNGHELGLALVRGFAVLAVCLDAVAAGLREEVFLGDDLLDDGSDLFVGGRLQVGRPT